MLTIKGKIIFILKGFATVIFFSIILFICAGKIDYIQGWIFLSTNVITTIMNFFTIRNNIDLINERSKPGEGVKSWDKILLGLSAIIYILTIIIAGLDSGRYQWSPSLHWSYYIVGIFLTIFGQILFFIARNENKYFSSVVRIQTERGHTVCDTGPYRVIRHPGYLGMIISLLGIPLFWPQFLKHLFA